LSLFIEWLRFLVLITSDENQQILHTIASDSLFPNPLSPFRQGPLRLQWPEIPSRALHLLDAGQAGELLMCYVGISANDTCEISNI